MKLRMMLSLVFCKDECYSKDSDCWSDCRERIQRMLERHDEWNLDECFEDVHIN